MNNNLPIVSPPPTSSSTHNGGAGGAAVGAISSNSIGSSAGGGGGGSSSSVTNNSTTNTTTSSPMMNSSSVPIRHINNSPIPGFGLKPTLSNNNLAANSSRDTTSGVPQYQQYFSMLQTMASSNSSSLSNLPSTSSIMAMHGIPSATNSSVLRKTSFSAILSGNAPKSVNLQTLSSQIATPQSTIQTTKPKNNSPPSSTSTAVNSSNFSQLSPAMGVVSIKSAQNSSELVASGTVPSNLLEMNGVSNNSIRMNNSETFVEQGNVRPIPISETIASPTISTPKQRKPRKKKGEETPSSITIVDASPSLNLSQSFDSSLSPQQGNDEDSTTEKSKGRSKTCKRWTEEQNRLLKEAVIKYGPRNWKKIAAEICGGIFTADQCNQHWHRVLHPRIIKGEWTTEEDNLLIEKVEEFGESSWTKVAEFLAGRTDIQCRHRYFQKKKENESGRRRSSITSISSPFIGGSSSSPIGGLGGQTSAVYDLSPMLGTSSSSSTIESTQAILNSALMSGVNFPSPSMGISPSSILSGAATNTSNFVHHHRVPLFSAPSTVPLQERLKGDSVVLGSSTTPTMSSSPFLGSNMTDVQIPPFPESIKKKQNQYFYVEKNGLDESDFTPPLTSSVSSPIQLVNTVSSDGPSLEKKELSSNITIGSSVGGNSTPNINENLLLCDEEDLSTPNIEKDLDSIKKKATPRSKNSSSSNMMITDEDEMDEDEEEAQLTIDDMDNEKVTPIVKSVNSQQNLSSASLVNFTPDLIKKEIPESPQLNSPAIVVASPSITNEKPKKRSSAMNRMRANINVWVPFSESEENILRIEISKQLKELNPVLPISDSNVPKPIQFFSPSNNEDFLDLIDFVTILKDNISSFHPLRTPISLKFHSQALRQELGDSILIDENFKGKTPRSLYEKVNSHSWLASSKNVKNSSAGITSAEPSKPGRRRKNNPESSDGQQTNGNTNSSGKPPIPGRKRKNAPVSNSPAMSIQSSIDSSSQPVVSSVVEPSQKKTKVEEQAANSTFLVLLLANRAPKETKQIQPSKMCLPLETTLSELVSRIREELSINYDPQLICDFRPVTNYAQTLKELMEENDIKINELLIQYK